MNATIKNTVHLSALINKCNGNRNLMAMLMSRFYLGIPIWLNENFND